MSLRNTAFPCVCLLLLLSGCAQLPEKPTLPAENSLAVGADGCIEVSARSVILATGGFQGNAELLARYVSPQAQHL